MERTLEESAGQRGVLPGGAGALGSTATGGAQTVDAQMNIGLDVMTSAQLNMMQSTMTGLKEVVGCPGMTKADVEQRWREQSLLTTGEHRGPGAADARPRNIDEYAMQFGYKNIVQAPTTAPPNGGNAGMNEMQNSAASGSSSSAAPSASGALGTVKKRVLKVRKSDESIKPTERCLMRDFADMDLAEESHRGAQPQEEEPPP